MRKIEFLLQSVEKISIANAILYNISDLSGKLYKEDILSISCDELIITPYYVQDGKRYELYWCSLRIRCVETIDYSQHLLQLTGKRRLEEIPLRIVEQQRYCYVEVDKKEKTMTKAVLERYISFLFHYPQIKEEVEAVFCTFETYNLYYEFD